MSLSVGQTQQLKATGAFSDGSSRDLTSSATWTSQDANVAAMNASGLLTAKSTGNTTVTATFNNISGNASFSIGPATLSSIVITPGSTTSYLGSTQQFAADGVFTDGTHKDLTGSATWSSSNTFVASVTSAGQFVSKSEGLTSLSATSGSVTGTLNVAVISKPRFAFTPDAGRVNSYIVAPDSGHLLLTSYSASVNDQDICTTPSKDKKFLVVSYYRSAGSNPGFVRILRVDATSGELSQVTDIPAPATAPGVIYSPTCVTFEPRGKFMYVVDSASGNVAGFAFDSSSGTVSPVPGSPFTTGSGPIAPVVDPLGRFLYVSNSGTSDVSLFAIDGTSGALTPVNNPMLQSFSQTNALSMHPSGKWVVDSASNNNRISVFSVGNSGALTFVNGSQRTVLGGPSRVVFDPTGSFAYFTGLTISGSTTTQTLEADRFDQNTGLLQQITTIPLLGGFGTPVIDPEGKHLYLVTGSGGFETFQINSDGTLAAHDQFSAAYAINSFDPISFIGSTGPATVNTTFVYAADAGTNRVFGFTFNGATGALMPTSTASYPAGARLTSMAADFYGHHIYAVSEKNTQPTQANVFAFQADVNGILTADPSSNFSYFMAQPEWVQTDNTGNYVYVTDSFIPENFDLFFRSGSTLEGIQPKPTNGHVSSVALDPFGKVVLLTKDTSNSITGFQLGSSTGLINFEMPGSPFATGTTPVDVSIDPLGRFVYVANAGSGDVSIYQLKFSPTGFTLVSNGSITVAGPPRSLGVDALGRFLFVGTTNGLVDVYRIDASSGALTSAGAASYGGTVQSTTTDRTGNFLFIGTSLGLSVASVNGDGTLSPASSIPLANGDMRKVVTINHIQ